MPDLFGNTTDDPLDDRPRIGPNGCRRGGSCDGSGWVQVGEKYHEWLGKKKAEELGLTDPQHIADQIRFYSQYAFSYPCKSCAPDVFLRWAGGHFNSEHDELNCDECVETRGGRGAIARRRKKSNAGANAG